MCVWVHVSCSYEGARKNNSTKASVYEDGGNSVRRQAAFNLLPMEKRIVCPVSAPTLAPYAAAVVAATVATSIELIPAIPALRDVVLVPGRCEQQRRHTSVIEPNIKEHVYDWAKCLISYNIADKEI
ncbi:hypothetical protein CBL_13897 [Carabus blaptoides fortunei]